MPDAGKPSLVALTRPVSKSIGRCELTHVTRQPIDVARARAQHREYRAALERLGCHVHQLTEQPDLPDSVFVEDAAVVLDEVAIMTRPGAASRLPELDSVEQALCDFRPISRIEAPGTLDGGDVLCVGRVVYIGLTTRTNRAAIEQFRGIVDPKGYHVVEVEVRDCLHLKSAVTWAGGDTILMNPLLVSPDVFSGHDLIEVDRDEPGAANVVVVGDTVLCSASFPRTRKLLSDRGVATEVVASDELAKAEGALTCCSLVFKTAQENE